MMWRSKEEGASTPSAPVSLLAALGLAAGLLAGAEAHGRGFPNVTQTPGKLLSGSNAPQQGRTAVIAWQNGYLVTSPEKPSSASGSDYDVRVWDIANPSNPVQRANLGDTPQGINAHGYLHLANYLVLSGSTNWSLQIAADGTVTRGTAPGLDGAYSRGDLYQPWDIKTFWSYGAVSDPVTFTRKGVTLATWNHLGLTGVIGHPFIIGNLLIYASDQSRTGVATYDLTAYMDGDPNNNPAQPPLLDVLNDGGPGGYWPELWGGNGKLYVVFPYNSNGKGIRVVDVTDPSDLKFVADKPLTGSSPMYAQFQDEFAFVGSHKVDMRTLTSVLNLNNESVVRTNDGGIGLDVSQFALPLGNLLVTGGLSGDLAKQGMGIWAHQSTPDTRGPYVGYHIPRAGQTSYPVGASISLLIHETLEPTTIVNKSTFFVEPLDAAGNPGAALDGQLIWTFNDTLQFNPTLPLQTNTTYRVRLPTGTTSIKDAAGNAMQAYSFTFSTGSSGNRAPVVSGLSSSAYPVAPGGATTLSATASDPEGGALQYRFDFGDGTAQTLWGTASSVSHTYAAAGHFRATVQVKDPVGNIASRTVTVTVLTAPTGAQPTHSATILLDGRTVWAVNPDSDTVTAIDADTLAKKFEVAVGAGPRSLARAADGTLWVACEKADRIDILSGSTGARVTSLQTGYGSAPMGVAMSPNGASAFVTLSGDGVLKRFATATRAETGSLALGASARSIAVTADGARVLVTRFISQADHGEVWDVNATSTTALALTRTFVLRRDRGPDTTASGRGVPNYVADIIISPDGKWAWYTAKKDNTERGTFFDLGTGLNEPLDQDNTTRTIIGRIDLVSNVEPRVNERGTNARVDLDNSDQAAALAWSPLGDYAFVTVQGNNSVAVFDALELLKSTGTGGLVTRVSTGAAPQGVVVDAVTRRVFVQDFLGRTVTVLNASGFLRSGDGIQQAGAVSTVTTEKLTAQVLQGKRLFYNASNPKMSAEGYMSCATCHVDGGQDGRVWDFTQRGEGLRNTIDLRGRAGLGQGRLHWSANFDEVQDFENDIRLEFGGDGFLTDADFTATREPLGTAKKAGRSAELDALAAYVTSLNSTFLPRSPHRNSDGTMTAAASAGAAVFQAQGCATCHVGTGFTDSVMRDVGTLRTSSGNRLGATLTGIDTPTLLGLWDTAPYFHDGSAPALTDVFKVAGGDLYQAENGARAGTTSIPGYIEINEDSSCHGKMIVLGDNSTTSPLGSVTFTSVQGGVGGTGAIELRYTAPSSGSSALVTVNGTTYTVALTQQKFSNDWNTVRIEGVTLTAGLSNTIKISHLAGKRIGLDDFLVTLPDDLARAAPHRKVLGLSATDQANLAAYLREL